MVAACSPSEQANTSTYVSEESCAGCHTAQSKAWAGSHHDLAMQDANEQTVLGNFNNSRFSYSGINSRFYRRDGKYFVTTDGPDGKLAEFEIRHTFGVEPLQQYLIELPGGRLQALSIAWDTRRKRWFHLYPNERIDHRDELHWTKLSQNWNHMCGECHATDYRKNYDAATGAYNTTAKRFDVGCQACHGPASRHLAWAQNAESGAMKSPAGARKQDFTIDLAARESRIQVETCARCHSRRSTLSADYRHGAPLMDSHLPALLTEPLYYADGQIRDEVYVYGSFLQSKMHARGVRCSDCHEPHSTKLRAQGNSLCASCHNATAPKAGAHIDISSLGKKNYDAPAHHHHKPGASGSLCVDCHAPSRNYMVVDPRRDHSFRIPRPDLSTKIGTPNACNECHQDRSSNWAADTVARWYGPQRRREKHYGEVFAAATAGQPGSVRDLVTLVKDKTEASIVRATALDLLNRYQDREALVVFQDSLKDADPLVRRAAVVGHERLAAAQRVTALAPLLDDPVLAVRIEAARLLAPADKTIPAERKAQFDRALAEFRNVQVGNADRPEAHVNLGNFYAASGDLDQAIAAYRKAIELDPVYVPGYINLADTYRARGDETSVEKSLLQAIAASPGSAAAHHSLGLSLVRQRRTNEALGELRKAAELDRDNARFSYIYGVALNSAGQSKQAIRILQGAHDRHPNNRDIVGALMAFHRDMGNASEARRFAEKLQAMSE
ncbi:MAG: hypothetical protein AMS22_08490 [Thiotrichales bacterium SG8_50]|nr:MAG: hypothetical protein AMS22_08490 [Thiotrichales bacterium SG8_50]